MKTARFVLSCHSVGTSLPEIALSAWMSASSFAGAATFLVKVKAHRGEPANEEADIQGDKAISGKDVSTEWHNRTNRAVFIYQELFFHKARASLERRYGEL